MTILEVMVSLGLLASIFLGFAATASLTSTQREAARERLVAVGVLTDFIESKRTLTVQELLALPPGDVPAVGKTDVTSRGLHDATGLFVRITDENPAVSSQLTAADRMALGFPAPGPLGFDLNGDGDTNDTAVPAESLTLLPGKVSLSWTSVLGGKQKASLVNV